MSGHRRTLPNHDCLNAIRNESNTELSEENEQYNLKQAVSLGTQRMNYGDSYPVVNNMLFMEEEINVSMHLLAFKV